MLTWRHLCTNTGVLLLFSVSAFAQKLNDFSFRTDPLCVKVEKFDKLIRSDHWNEGIIIPRVIFPPVGLDRPVIGGHADALDETGHLLAGYCFK
jgi:hypothetical protein